SCCSRRLLSHSHLLHPLNFFLKLLLFLISHQIKNTQNRTHSSLPYPTSAASPSEGRFVTVLPPSAGAPRSRRCSALSSPPPLLRVCVAVAAVSLPERMKDWLMVEYDYWRAANKAVSRGRSCE
ncbi:hypothetical protein LINPERHAP1_LOCUS18130, partial [Linum perenne]